MRGVAPDHFRTGVWRAGGPLGFRHFTCLSCGSRYATWWAFREHRANRAWCANREPGLELNRLFEQLQREAEP